MWVCPREERTGGWEQGTESGTESTGAGQEAGGRTGSAGTGCSATSLKDPAMVRGAGATAGWVAGWLSVAGGW